MGVVPGRIGAGQMGAPYRNPFGVSGYCRSNCTAEDSPHQNDGYKACLGWNHVVTVWRNAAEWSTSPPVTTTTSGFSPTTPYLIQPLNGGGAVSLGAGYGSATNGAQFQQMAGTADYQRFFIVGTGNGNYELTFKSAPGKCVDHPTSPVADGTRLQIWDCSGSSNQQWQITPDAATGVFSIKSAYAGRCIDQPAGSSASGLQMQVYSCTAGNRNQLFAIKPSS